MSLFRFGIKSSKRKTGEADEILTTSGVAKQKKSSEEVMRVLNKDKRYDCEKRYLDTSSTSDDLQPGTKLDLSFWMARALCSRKRHIVSVEMPRPYREGYREILTADANVVDLHKLGPYYYSYGSQLLKFEMPETADVAKSLIKCFQTRIRKIMDSSQNAYNEDTTKLTEKLDETEKCLFKAGQIGLNDFQRWETRQTEKLTTSEMVRSHRKRKRALMDDS